MPLIWTLQDMLLSLLRALVHRRRFDLVGDGLYASLAGRGKTRKLLFYGRPVLWYKVLPDALSSAKDVFRVCHRSTKSRNSL